jgi:dTDP-4-amino-4,6-dideoxygalactose transaminase
VLSKFLGTWHPDFYGGPQVLAAERAWAEYVGATHAVAVNSATSGLLAAVGAAGIGPGDEVIVSPYTMSATATVILLYGGIPVFADIDPQIFCLDPASVRSRITPRTKALMVVHLFGHPADMAPLLALARKHNLVVIEDAAQAPGALYQGRKVGTLGDMTVFSLNYHKHIHTGEGGIVTTNSEEYAERLRLIRNHGESVVAAKGVPNIVNAFGLNLRMGEMEAALCVSQLAKLEGLLAQRIANVECLSARLAHLPGLTPPVVRQGCRHVFYDQVVLFDPDVVGVSRNQFVEAVSAELPTAEDVTWPLIGAGYVEPLYLLPMFQRQIAIGANGWPFSAAEARPEYHKGLCPVTERLQDRHLISNEFMRPPCTPADMKDVADAFEKVYEHRTELAGAAMEARG